MFSEVMKSASLIVSLAFLNVEMLTALVHKLINKMKSFKLLAKYKTATNALSLTHEQSH